MGWNLRRSLGDRINVKANFDCRLCYFLVVADYGCNYIWYVGCGWTDLQMLLPGRLLPEWSPKSPMQRLLLFVFAQLCSANAFCCRRAAPRMLPYCLTQPRNHSCPPQRCWAASRAVAMLGRRAHKHGVGSTAICPSLFEQGRGLRASSKYSALRAAPDGGAPRGRRPWRTHRLSHWLTHRTRLTFRLFTG